MFRIKKNDTVKVLAGKDRGKTGKVVKIDTTRAKAMVQGINYVKRHTKRVRQDVQGGIIQKEAFMDISNLAIVCKACNRATRIGVDIMDDGSKVRYCKKCKEVM